MKKQDKQDIIVGIIATATGLGLIGLGILLKDKIYTLIPLVISGIFFTYSGITYLIEKARK